MQQLIMDSFLILDSCITLVMLVWVVLVINIGNLGSVRKIEARKMVHYISQAETGR